MLVDWLQSSQTILAPTELSSLFAFGFVDDTVGALTHDSNDLILVHVPLLLTSSVYFETSISFVD